MSKSLTFLGFLALILLTASRGLADDTNYWAPRGVPGQDSGVMKTIEQVEPRIVISSLPYFITNSGSYYLTCKLVATNATAGITISADDVKLDLNGFSLNGMTNQNTSQNGCSGIWIANNPPHYNIIIKNGVIRGWGWYGIFGTNASETTIENVKLYGNGLSGIVIGPNAMIDNCCLYNNGHRSTGTMPLNPTFNDGIRADDYSTVRECKARFNGGSGIYISFGGRVTGCTSCENLANGIFAESYSSIKDCLIIGNSGGGISVQSQCRVIDNTCGRKMNTMGMGIRVDGTGNRIENNNVTGNQYGIQVTSGGSSNLITCNSASGNMYDFDMANSNLNSFGDIVPVAGGSVSNSNPWANFKF